ncbi:MAG: DUF1211 domain-containing protein [Verrucomicrobia bacterium]|nr:DUF1211 domain-containing protein [Verrucomicrobiota bacterium]
MAPPPRFRWRDRLPGRRPEAYFRWRGKEVSRLENLADGVFAFAVTLLVVAQQVPTTFEGLMEVIRSFPAFVASFVLLMFFWNVHYRFFRRFGFEDFFTRMVNYVILLLVIFSVYPLKFLFSAWLGGGKGVGTLDNLFLVYRIYGLGLAGIWGLFGVLYWHALRQREELGLSPVEEILTRLDLWSAGINVATCGLSIGLSFLPVHPWVPGLIYASLGLTLWFNGTRHGRQVEAELARQRNGRANGRASDRD